MTFCETCKDQEECNSLKQACRCDDCSNRCPFEEGAVCDGCGCYQDCCDCENICDCEVCSSARKALDNGVCDE